MGLLGGAGRDQQCVSVLSHSAVRPPRWRAPVPSVHAHPWDFVGFFGAVCQWDHLGLEVDLPWQLQCSSKYVSCELCVVRFVLFEDSVGVFSTFLFVVFYSTQIFSALTFISLSGMSTVVLRLHFPFQREVWVRLPLCLPVRCHSCSCCSHAYPRSLRPARCF